MQLNQDQTDALEKIVSFLSESSDTSFVLSGPAGTGKTFCIKELLDYYSIHDLSFTAPTNKATQVMRNSLIENLAFDQDENNLRCATIYSFLGLKLRPDGGVKKLTDNINPYRIQENSVVVVDEASMVNEILMKKLLTAAEEYDLKIIFMGDQFQLPPVGEDNSPIWDIPNMAELKKVMRHDNQILKLAQNLREYISFPATALPLIDDNDGEEGVWRLSMQDFIAAILKDADEGRFTVTGGSKAIAWRNRTVDRINELVRSRLFPDCDVWTKGDRLITTAPVIIDCNGTQEIIASTDSEGTVECVDHGVRNVFGKDYSTYEILVKLDNGDSVELTLPRGSSKLILGKHLNELAAMARKNSRLWKDFWGLKETFHDVKYSYALTAHRAQGSTYETAFVHAGDIMANFKKFEALRCLYVACTRPSKRLILV